MRIALLDRSRGQKGEYIGNAVQVNASWKPDKEDVWKFNPRKENGLNPILLRISELAKGEDGLVLDCGKIDVIFEFVLFVRQKKRNNKLNEVSCGWCKHPLLSCKNEV